MTTSPCAFVAAYFSTKKCELYRNEQGTISAYVPTRDNAEGILELGTDSYVTAEIAARECGLDPVWN